MNYEPQKTRFRIRRTWKREEEDTLRRRAKSQIAAIGTGTKETLGIDTANLIEEDVMRLWSKVGETKDKRDCWLWKGCKNEWGYGVIGINKKSYTSHRLTFLLHFAEPVGELCVMHKCDNPLCCNPHHLFSGTQLDNMLDRDRKGRQAKGDRSSARLHPHSRPKGVIHYAAKLTEKAVLIIRGSTTSVSELATIFKVHTSSINDIRTRRTWAHLP